MADNNTTFKQARDHIEKGRYNDARSVLRGINDPAARNKVVSWLNKIDELDPPFEPDAMSAVSSPSSATSRKSGRNRSVEEPVSATHSAIILNNEGVLYDIRGGCLIVFFRRTLQESGYIPLLDVTTMGIIRQRVLSHVGAVLMYSVLQILIAVTLSVLLQNDNTVDRQNLVLASGIASGVAFLIVLLLWLVLRRTGLIVYSHGTKMLIVPMKQKVAQAYVEQYRELRFGG